MFDRYAPLLLIIALAACKDSAPDAAPAEDQAAAASPTPAPHHYLCESSRTVVVTYPSDSTATVEYQSRSRTMALAVSASGARYVDDSLEWWTKGSGVGSEGTLYARASSEEAADTTIESCKETPGK